MGGSQQYDWPRSGHSIVCILFCWSFGWNIWMSGRLLSRPLSTCRHRKSQTFILAPICFRNHEHPVTVVQDHVPLTVHVHVLTQANADASQCIYVHIYFIKLSKCHIRYADSYFLISQLFFFWLLGSQDRVGLIWVTAQKG